MARSPGLTRAWLLLGKQFSAWQNDFLHSSRNWFICLRRRRVWIRRREGELTARASLARKYWPNRAKGLGLAACVVRSKVCSNREERAYCSQRRDHTPHRQRCNLISTLVSCNCELAPLWKLPPPPVKWIWQNIARRRAVGWGIAHDEIPFLEIMLLLTPLMDFYGPSKVLVWEKVSSAVQAGGADGQKKSHLHCRILCLDYIFQWKQS